MSRASCRLVIGTHSYKTTSKIGTAVAHVLSLILHIMTEHFACQIHILTPEDSLEGDGITVQFINFQIIMYSSSNLPSEESTKLICSLEIQIFYNL